MEATWEGVMGLSATEGDSRRFLAEGVSFVGSIPSGRATFVGPVESNGERSIS